MKTSSIIALALLYVTLAGSPAVAQTSTAASREAVYTSALPIYADNSTQPLAATIVTSGAYDESTWQKIVFSGVTGDRVPSLLFLPLRTSMSAPAPCLMLLHGLGGSKEQLIPVARFLAGTGYAVFMIDDAGQGERKDALHPMPTYSTEEEFTKQISSDTEETVTDLRRGVDYLETRPEVDSKKIGMMGISLGALVGTVFAAVEPRVQAAILISGGGNLGEILSDQAASGKSLGGQYASLIVPAGREKLQEQLDNIDPINFVAHISPRPILMEHGGKDPIIPPATAAALFDAAHQPKNIDWYPEAGHPPSPLEIYPAISLFLSKVLPAPQPAQSQQ